MFRISFIARPFISSLFVVIYFLASLARIDPGFVPVNAPKLSFFERILIAPLRPKNYWFIVNNNSRVQRSSKGHVIAFPNNHAEHIAVNFTPSVLKEIPNSIRCCIISSCKSLEEVRSQVEATKIFQVNGASILYWSERLHYIYKDHPVYNIQMASQEVLIAYSKLQNQVPEEIIENAFTARNEEEAEILNSNFAVNKEGTSLSMNCFSLFTIRLV